MAKEKVKKKENKEKSEVYYEVFGAILVCFVFIVLTMLGKVGIGLNIFFHIIIGDWYWLVLFSIGVIGVKIIVKRSFIDLKSLRMNGYFLFILCLVLLSHISMYKYSLNFNKNPLIGTWNLYLSYLDDYNENYILGGGLIGALIYQLLVFLLGEIGTLFFIILLLFISIIFMTNNSLFSFIDYIKIFPYKLKNKSKKVFKYIENIDFPKVTKHKKKLININLLKDINTTNDLKEQEKISIEQEYSLIKILDKISISKLQKKDIGYQATRYYLDKNNISLYELKKEIQSYLSTTPIIYKDEHNTYIEINNKYRSLLTLKRLLLQNNDLIKSNNPNSNQIDYTYLNFNHIFPIGLDLSNEIIYFNPFINNHLLIIGSSDSGIKNFINSFIITLLIYKTNFKLYINDPKEEFYVLRTSSYLDITYSTKKDFQIIDKIQEELEKRIQLYTYLQINTFPEYIKVSIDKNMEEPYLIFFILNSYEEYVSLLNFDNRLSYLLNMGDKFGIHIFIVNRKQNTLNPIYKTIIKTKIVFKTNTIDLSLEVLNNDFSINLSSRGDFIYLFESSIKRGQTPYISNQDFINIIK